MIPLNHQTRSLRKRQTLLYALDQMEKTAAVLERKEGLALQLNSVNAARQNCLMALEQERIKS